MPLLKSLKDDGHQIFTVSHKDEYSTLLIEAGFSFEEIKLNNNGTNPVDDLKTIYQYYKIYKNINPDVICHNAIKPNIYGTIAAGMLGIKVVNNISGLGTLFIKKSISTYFAKFLYKVSQTKATKVFFQNSDDLDLFSINNLINRSKCIVIPGSGVNTKKFKPVSKTNKSFHFLFIGRLLYDKGILEYVDAAKKLKKKYPTIVFNILGPLYMNNSTGITKKTLEFWIDSQSINYLGHTDSVEKVLETADCVVLPSYREGLSKVLIESSSMAIPIVTTNVPGCKDVVVDGETGFLCRVKDSNDLLLKMEKMLLLSLEERNLMGEKARDRAVNLFDQEIIIKHYKDTIYSLF
tara:strand:- start:1102 stop:2151 length:1050 start_codon:yes stop_codon:yes gene_type:complete